MSAKNHSSSTTPCPCGTAQAYAQCCGVFHLGAQFAPTAQALMRSRYSAYVMNDFAYLRASWHPSTCPVDLIEPDVEASALATEWRGLRVEQFWSGGCVDEAFVEFIAEYQLGTDRIERLHEISRFVREGGRWLYVDGIFP